MLFVLVLSGSRSSWLYLLWFAASAYFLQRRDAANRSLFLYAVFVLIGFGLMHLVVQIPWFAGASGSTNSVERLFGSNASGGIRLALWRESWFIFTQFPILGAGFGQFAWQHFNLDIAQHNFIINGLYNNAHNILIQTAAEMGLLGIAVLLGTMFMWVWLQRSQSFSIYHWWGYALLMVMAIHSMLEYPLWYAYFIGIAAITLGLFDFTSYRLELRNLGRLSVVSMLLLGVVSLYQAKQGYGKLELALSMRAPANHDSTYVPRIREALVDAHAYPLVSSYAELFMSSMIEPSVDHLADKIRLNEHAMHFVPIASVVYRQAWLLQLSGKTEEAKSQLEKSIWSWQSDFAAAHIELSNLARKDPEHFAALLEFATQKNEEYLRAVRTK
jgi:O-antigen ligase